MTTSSQPHQVTQAPLKSVWKKLSQSNYASSSTSTQSLVNGSADEAHEKDSVSSKDVTQEDVIQGEGSTVTHSTPASSTTDEVGQINSPQTIKATPVYSTPFLDDGPAQIKPSQLPKGTRIHQLSSNLTLPITNDTSQIKSPRPSNPHAENSSSWTLVASKDNAHTGKGHLAPSTSGNDDPVRRSASPRSPKPVHRQNSSPQQQPVYRPSRVGSSSSKDANYGGSSQGHSTTASSITDEPAESSTEQPPAPAPVFRPAPLPAVNPWKVRQEEMERKRWKESQDTPPVPIQQERIVLKPPTNVPSKSGNKPNGVVKSEGFFTLIFSWLMT
jgi:hypothetical protein